MRFLIGCLFLFLSACMAPVNKPDAMDRVALHEQRPQLLLAAKGSGVELVKPGPAWLVGVEPLKQNTFARLQAPGLDYVLLLKVDIPADQLLVLPLEAGETPLGVLADTLRRRKLAEQLQDLAKGGSPPSRARSLVLSELLAEQGFGMPLPQPQQIFAVAANYPSHLLSDLAFGMDAGAMARLADSRPRIFLKYPPIAPPGQSWPVPEAYRQIQGPFAALEPPDKVLLPDQQGRDRHVIGHLDYEAEIAAVVGRRLTWGEVKGMSDAELMASVAGYLLFSDAKLRDPQVMGRIVRVMGDVEAQADNVYLVGDEGLDAALGVWDAETCQWWSYAAGWGRYASAGPLLVTAPEDGHFPERLLLAGRSYAPAGQRGAPLPAGVEAGPWLLRQAALTTTDRTADDHLIWSLPAIIRSILDPRGNALAFHAAQPVIEAGDFISLGTPGGTVITAKPSWLLPLAENLLFWSESEDFYQRFFNEARGYYLHPGDRLLLWADGLGYQRLDVSGAITE